MKKIVRYTAVLLAGLLLLTACGRNENENKGGSSAAAAAYSGFDASALIGISLPQKTSENWVDAERLFKERLQKAGFKSDVQFANNGVSEQQAQIAAMAAAGAKVIVVGAIDGSLLDNQLKQAKDAGAIIIAYDRLLTNTKNVDFYITYNGFEVGVLQGKALLQGLEAKKAGGPWNIELFAGSPDDANSKTFFDGAMSVLKPQIDAGKLKVVSGQTDFSQVVTQGWKAENAQNRMDTLLSSHYQGAELDGVLSPNDVLARAVLRSVDLAGKPQPVVTGQDAEEESLKMIEEGKQYSTIAKDTGNLVDSVLAAIKSLQKGILPLINDNTNFDNGKKIVPAYLLDPKIITKENVATLKN